MEKGDDSEKDLYGIRGLNDTECDAPVPASWMKCPPIKLDLPIPDMEALRFQYTNLFRYSRQVTRHWKGLQQNYQALESAYSKERKQRRQVQAEVLSLRARVGDVEAKDAQLQKWEARRPLINHYLGVVAKMARDIETMRDQLSVLGYHVPDRSYVYDPEKPSQVPGTHPPQPGGSQQHKSGSFSCNGSINEMHGHGASVRRPGSLLEATYENSLSSRKRKFADHAPETIESNTLRNPKPRISSRDLMPPPLLKPKPPQRLNERAPGHSLGQLPTSKQRGQVYRCKDWRVPQAGSLPENRGYGPDRYQGRQALAQAYSHNAAMSGQNSTGLHETSYRAPQSSQNKPNIWHQQVEPHDAISRPRQPLLHSRNRHVIAHDSDSNNAAYYRDGQVQQPLRPALDSNFNQRPSMKLPASQASQGVSPIPSPQRTMAGCVSSPFFRRGNVSSPVTHGHPPTRRSIVQNQHNTIGQSLDGVHSVAPLSRDKCSSSQRSALDGLSYIEQPHRAANRKPQFEQLKHQLPSDYPRDPSAAPQTPRNFQGLRPGSDFQSPSRAYEPRGSKPDIHHELSFLPSLQLKALAGNRDQALSHMPGVRSASSQGVRLHNSPNGYSYGESSKLCSPACGYGSVRR